MRKQFFPVSALFAVICLSGVLSCPGKLGAQEVFFKRGDVNQDGKLDLSDAIFIVQRLFVIDEEFVCPDSADASDDGLVDVTDVIKIAGYLFMGVAEPPPPFSECGLDPSEDELGCASFALCEPEEETCFDAEAAAAIVGGIEFEEGLVICLPAGGAKLPVEGFEVGICPAAEAPADCGDTGEPGCPIEILGASPVVDIDEGVLGVRIEGRVENLPISVDTGFLGTTVCTLTLHSAEGNDVPFNFEIIVPLVIEKNEEGRREIVAIGEAVVENPDIELDASGGLLCGLFGAAQDAISDLLLQPFAGAIDELVATAREDLIGLEICE